MKTEYKPPAELATFLKPYAPPIRKLALALRAVVLEELAPCYENIYDAYSAVAIGYGSSERFSDGICHVAVYSQHVNLGFNEGAFLADPKKILKGSGKRIRHITIKSPDDLSRPEIRSFLKLAQKLALADARKLGGTLATPPAAAAAGVISTVKAVYKKKRRPA